MALSDEQMVENSLLYISVRENIPFVEKLVKVRRQLEQGADVNAQDGNDGGNTPLHMAARCGEEALVDLLLNRGADGARKNWNGQTPLDIARSIYPDQNVVKLLQSAKKLISDEDISQTSSSPSHYLAIQSTTNECNSVQPTNSCLKRATILGVCDQYELQLLTLVLIRVLNDDQIEDFFLGTNIRGIGNMNNICLRYTLKGHHRPVVLFVQVKHRKGRNNANLTVKDSHNTHGGIILLKYFESYLAIKNRFKADNVDPMFEKNFRDVEWNLVIYTTGKTCISKKNTESQISDKVHHLINTEERTEVFQYDYNVYETKNLSKMMVIKQLKKMGQVFLKMIISNKDKTYMILADKLIAKYHVVMAREVLHQSKVQDVNKHYRMWEFNPDFFESDSEYLIALRTTISKLLTSKRCDRSKITNEDRDNFELVVREPSAATISKLIGKSVIYKKKTKRLQLVGVTAFKNMFKTNEFNTLLAQLSKIEINEIIVNEAIKIKLASIKIRLPLSFGNTDMTFPGSEAKVQRKIKTVASKLIKLLKINETTMVLDINDVTEQSVIGINGGIGSAVGNLLILDPETEMLKFDLDKESLPDKAALFLKELKDAKHNPVNEKLSSYRINVNVMGFPKFSLNENKNERQIKDFLGRVWFCTNQAKEDEIEKVIKNDIDKYYRHGRNYQIDLKLHVDSNTVFQKAYENVQEWWKQVNEANYLSRLNNFFHTAKIDCYKHQILKVVNYFKIQYGIDTKLEAQINQIDNFLQSKVIIKFESGQECAMKSICDTSPSTVSYGLNFLVQIIETLQNVIINTVPSTVGHKMNVNKINIISQIMEIFQNVTIDTVPSTIGHESNVNNFKYQKKKITSSVEAQLYETKLVCLILIRALNDEQIEKFLLGTNMRHISDINICLRYRVKDHDRPIMLLLQAQQRKCCDKKILANKNKQNSPGDFLFKCLKSYFLVKDLFQSHNKDPMFKGNFEDVECNFIVYTPTKNCLTKKNFEQQLSKKAHYLINTKENTEVFQYDYDEDDIEMLSKMTAIERFEEMGVVFIRIITSENYKSHMILENRLIARYHVVMRREVLQESKVCDVNKDYRMWEFKPEFFESKCEYLFALHKIFIKELSSKRCDQSKITNEDLNNVMLILKNPCAATISKLIGKLVTYNYESKKLQFVNITTFGESNEKEWDNVRKLFNEIETNVSIINEAVKIKLLSIKIRLPLSFGNLDMTFRGSKSKVQKRMKAVAEKLFDLLKLNEDTMILNINENNVGPGKMIEQGMIGINGGIGSAVGNLLILDPDTNMLKFDLENETLPDNARLFVKELRNARYTPINEKLSYCRINIHVIGFPEDYLHTNEKVRSQIREFFTKHWFYQDQTKEIEIERTVKKDIAKYYVTKETNQTLFEIDSDIILQGFYNKVQKLLMQSKDVRNHMRRTDIFFNLLYLSKSNSSIDFEILNDVKNSAIIDNLYETKLLCLIYIRGVKDEQVEKLHFGNNIRGVGDMDDICLRYQVRGQQRPIALFLQTHQRQDRDEDIFTCFRLRKFFESYIAIRDRFRTNNTDPMFEGDFGDVDYNFVMYMPSKDNFTKRKVEHVSDKIHYLINTGQDTEIFQYDHDKNDLDFLVKISIIDQLKKISTVFLKSIMPDKDKSGILLDKLIATYHVIVGREVLQQQRVEKDYCIWKFRPEFFDKDNKHLFALKRIFINDILTKSCDQSEITTKDLYYLTELIREPCAYVISKLIGKLVIYDHQTKKIIFIKDKVEDFKKLFPENSRKRTNQHFKDIPFDNSEELRQTCNSNVSGWYEPGNETNKRIDHISMVNTSEDLYPAKMYELINSTNIKIEDNVKTEAVLMKLASLEIKLPLAFGNLDMIFCGSEASVKERMKTLANKLIQLLELNKDTKLVEIKDNDVGPDKTVEQSIIDVYGGIGGAVGNLLVWDPNMKMLKFNLNDKNLPKNASLFLTELKNKTIIEELQNYRFRINVNGFPKDSIDDDENEKKQATDFLNKLWFYTNQANETELERIVKDEMNSLLL